jgi:hypothetical protein
MAEVWTVTVDRYPNERVRMENLHGIATSTSHNFLGTVCEECGQIAFKIIVFNVAGQEKITPLCGRHFLEACVTHPEICTERIRRFPRFRSGPAVA